ncbi:MAG: hypothetical protein R2867_05235 [Caldilineaceae bacterium]
MPRFLQRSTVAVIPLFLLLTLLLLLNACSRPEVDPMARYRPAMRPEFQADLTTLDSLPRYDMDVYLYPAENILTGTMRVAIVNTSSEPWQNIVFRLYPSWMTIKAT